MQTLTLRPLPDLIGNPTATPMAVREPSHAVQQQGSLPEESTDDSGSICPEHHHTPTDLLQLQANTFTPTSAPRASALPVQHLLETC